MRLIALMTTLILALLLTAPIPVSGDPLAHTYSIVARDPKTGEMGAAVQSHWFQAATDVLWVEAGVGAVATQSFVDPRYGLRGLESLRQGKLAPDVLRQLVEADPGRDTRQVAMVDSQGHVATHTGTGCIEAAGHQAGNQYSVQANLMANGRVWSAMAEAYEKTTGDLTDRMLAALDAAQAVGGDIRGQQSAAIIVVRATSSGRPWVGADRLFDVRVHDHPAPLTELRRLVRLQRAYNQMNAGDELLAARKVDEALQQYTKSVELAPEIPELAFWQAVTLVSIGRESDALPIFKTVFAREPFWVELLPRLRAAKQLPDDAALIERIQAQATPPPAH